MTTLRILVLGATGPSGICLLREAVFRNYVTVAYVRNVSKLPDDLVKNPLLEVIEGQMEDTERLGEAISKATVVISLLGPVGKPPSGEFPFPGYYSTIFPLMRSHSTKRILAMGTASIDDPNDKSSFIRRALVTGVRYGFSAAYRTILGIAKVFQEEAQDLDWTVFRLGMVQGGHDEESWKKDRDDRVFAGPVGEVGWTWYVRRGALAKWLVDRAEDGDAVTEHMPAISFHNA